MKANIDKIILNPEIATYNNYKWIATFYKNRNAKNNIEIYTKKLESFFDTLKHYSIKNTIPKSNVLITIYLLNNYNSLEKIYIFLDDKEELFKLLFSKDNEYRLMANIGFLKDNYNNQLLKYFKDRFYAVVAIEKSRDNYKKAETSNIDYKVSLEINKPKSWLKSVSAFANTKGGIILFGVDDTTHELKGLNNIQEVSEKITEIINSKILPLPRYEINTFVEDEKDFLELKIGDGPSTPYYLVSDGRKEAFIRSGNQSIPAPEHILNNLILKGKNLTFDALPTDYKISDLSFTLLSATIKEKTNKKFDENKDFLSLGLANEEKEITNAGLLLSDQNPLKQSKIVCTRWKGLSKGIISEDAIDDKEYSINEKKYYNC